MKKQNKSILQVQLLLQTLQYLTTVYRLGYSVVRFDLASDTPPVPSAEEDRKRNSDAHKLIVLANHHICKHKPHALFIVLIVARVHAHVYFIGVLKSQALVYLNEIFTHAQHCFGVTIQPLAR